MPIWSVFFSFFTFRRWKMKLFLLFWHKCVWLRASPFFWAKNILMLLINVEILIIFQSYIWGFLLWNEQNKKKYKFYIFRNINIAITSKLKELAQFWGRFWKALVLFYRLDRLFLWKNKENGIFFSFETRGIKKKTWRCHGTFTIYPLFLILSALVTKKRTCFELHTHAKSNKK